ncbi:hypothetical protein Clacol_010564 [Clathrus columnatus]|uniref:Uncharacterized protein n=1 Tax=Clathrus columnatus TaxID=1419009 RepID=A0AAV5ATD9_9AGAM|nr:hypothetical protein Clacol_001869 [Clathrus columnatus]GJJ16268.1 hypothetical protein Clacol_010564 [Clathrus columnatus]
MASSLPSSISKILSKPNPFARKGHQSLFETLSSLPNDGLGSFVAQTQWAKQGNPNSYWQVTKVKLKHEGQHGKAWGRLYWRGKLAETIKGRTPERERLIPGGLKHGWTVVQPKKRPNPDSDEHITRDPLETVSDNISSPN